jgi:hypothetical protein
MTPAEEAADKAQYTRDFERGIFIEGYEAGTKELRERNAELLAALERIAKMESDAWAMSNIATEAAASKQNPFFKQTTRKEKK